MSKEDKTKLDGIKKVTTASDGLMSKEDKTKMDTLKAYKVASTTEDGLMSKEDRIQMNTFASLAPILNRSFCIQWNLSDTVKTVTIGGNIALYETFKTWVTDSPKPCEINKSGADFAYLNKTDFALRKNGSASKHATHDLTYLQMVELSNINICAFEDTAKGVYQIWFNMDNECPAGFRRWFKNPTKLFGRYNSTFNSDGATIDCAGGTSQPSGNWSAIALRTRTEATATKLLNETAWESFVLSWIFTAYYQTVNHQEIFQGLSEGSEAVARGYVNGSCDTLTTPNGEASVTVASIACKPYRFMYIENAIHGHQWLWAAGGKTVSDKELWLCYDEDKANSKTALESLNDLEGFEFACNYVQTSGTYPKNVNVFNVLTTSGASSTTGFCDGQWSNDVVGNVVYRGGHSDNGAVCGGFALDLNTSPSSAIWNQRGRCALNR